MSGEISQAMEDTAESSQAADQAVRGRIWLAFGGIGFIYGAVIVFGVVCYMLIQDDRHAALSATEAAQVAKSGLSFYLPELILTGIGVFGAVLGVGLLRSVGIGGSQQPGRVINSKEWDAISDQVRNGQEDAVTQYIRLTSLTGFTGTFTKLGLTGLPLATIALTLFFSVLAISVPDTFTDLAKLTLGAFIGSFVQKQVGAAKPAGKPSE